MQAKPFAQPSLAQINLMFFEKAASAHFVKSPSFLKKILLLVLKIRGVFTKKIWPSQNG